MNRKDRDKLKQVGKKIKGLGREDCSQTKNLRFKDFDGRVILNVSKLQ